jgi:RimJ/RimL family protein N-acetyltransferase
MEPMLLSTPKKRHNFTFHFVDQGSYEKVLGWLKKPHIASFFHGDGLKSTLEDLAKFTNQDASFYHHWVGELKGVPFAYLMTSPVRSGNSADDRFTRHLRVGESAITLDLLIGEEEFLGKGLASDMILSFLLGHFSHITSAFIDPEVANTKAIHVYEKAGFKKLEQFLPSWNPVPHWLMKLDIIRLKIE